MRRIVSLAAVLLATVSASATPVVTDGPGFMFVYETTSISLSSHDTTPVGVDRPTGSLAISGGFDLNHVELRVVSNRPTNGNTRWNVTIYNPTGSTINQDVVVFATCWGVPAS